ncbi:glycosyltransferase family 4 protein [Gautieria morchelliformis]|nr:glycosyltransferase family 4 protein [Gautieria morchelliformis]
MLWLVIPSIATTFVLLASTSWLYLSRRTFRTTSTSKRRFILDSLDIHGTEKTRKRFVGFFHPYCNAGGGGERVLWTAIAFLQRTEPDVISVVYSGDKGITKQDIIDKVKTRFNIPLNPTSLYFIFLESRNLVEDATWPRFTLLGQSLGSMYLAWEAMSKLVPDLFIDTMGYAFTFYLVRLLSEIPVGAYVHYPTISTEMVRRVRSRTVWHTNSDAVSSSAILSGGKQLYYRIFMFYYSLSLHNASFLMVNSTWTKRHVDAVLDYATKDTALATIHTVIAMIARNLLTVARIERVTHLQTHIVYPPCDTKLMAAFSLTGRSRLILSLAQFRPEKDHATQLRSLAELLETHPEYRSGNKEVKLVLMGSSRNAEDSARIDTLRNLADELGIRANVDFVVNAPYPVLLDYISRASIGFSTMVDEHFGINIVEFLAAGLIPVVHASGGPLHDIVVPRNGEPTGFHCTSLATFAESLHAALDLTPEEDLAMRRRAREHAVERFSEREFELSWENSAWLDWREKLGLGERGK